MGRARRSPAAASGSGSTQVCHCGAMPPDCARKTASMTRHGLHPGMFIARSGCLHAESDVPAAPKGRDAEITRTRTRRNRPQRSHPGSCSYERVVIISRERCRPGAVRRQVLGHITDDRSGFFPKLAKRRRSRLGGRRIEGVPDLVVDTPGGMRKTVRLPRSARASPVALLHRPAQLADQRATLGHTRRAHVTGRGRWAMAAGNGRRRMGHWARATSASSVRTGPAWREAADVPV